jgi:RHS repeat-associated protein
VQQVDRTGATPLTITYTNDVAGLTQVLVADDGAEQVYNLFGLDLIGQDEGNQTRTLLADGLGSARMEMVEGDVASVTTYGPYGNLLTQMGNDEPIAGTDYGYTGEQHDASTGLLYLRARYYNPSLRSFMGRDPWSGNGGQPQSMNGWSYVENSPTNLIDPTGMFSNSAFDAYFFPDFCREVPDKVTYVLCVAKSFSVDTDVGKLFLYYHLDTSLNEEFDDAMDDVQGKKGCFWGPIPYRAPGYSEGFGAGVSFGISKAAGNEIVYDFAKFQRSEFSYKSDGLYDTFFGMTGPTMSISKVEGFTSWKESIADDYGGWTASVSRGFGLNYYLEFYISYNFVSSISLADLNVRGESLYLSTLAAGADLFPIGEGGISLTEYSLGGYQKEYLFEDESVKIHSLRSDIMTPDAPYLRKRGQLWFAGVMGWKPTDRREAADTALKYAWIYESMQLGWDKK